MVEIKTKYFGSIPLDSGLLVEFPTGLPAFGRERAFLAIEHPRTAPLVLLQSITTPDLCFLALPVSEVDPGYQLLISAEDKTVLGIEQTVDPPANTDVAALALIAVRQDGRVSANLMSPVVVNRANRRAIQSVRWDGLYSHEHLLRLPSAPAYKTEQPCS